MNSSTPPPSSLARAVELDNVRDVMLLEAAEYMRAEPIPRHEGAPAPLGRLQGRLRTSRATEDFDAERTLSLELSRVHFEHHLDVDMAVQLLHRALEIEDDRELRKDLARRLTAMGRHLEAGHVLRDGEPATKEEVFDSWMASGEAYARGAEPEEAVATFREAAMVAPELPMPFARIAEVAYWAPHVVPPERAADAWLEASKRYPLGSQQHALAIIRSFEVASAYARSTEAYTTLLWRTGRTREADEVWRAYGLSSGHAPSVAVRRAKMALKVEDAAIAVAAALEGLVACAVEGRAPSSSLDDIFADPRVLEWLGAMGGRETMASEIREGAAAKSSLARAEAFVRLANELTGEGASILWSAASDAFSSGGDAEQACRAALAATRLAPWLPHAQAALMALGADERIHHADIERALGRVPARSPLLRLAARRFEGHRLGLIYGRRLADTRPCDILPLVALLDRAIRLDDVEALVDTIRFVLATPRPWSELAEPLAQALTMVEGHDVEGAHGLARQVVSLLGPGDGTLYRTLRRIAEKTGDRELKLDLVLGRAVSDQIENEERAAVYLEAVEISLEHADVQSAAIHTSRAAAHAGELDGIIDAIERIHGMLDTLEPSQRSDAHIALARANAWAAEQQDPTSAVEAWRYLGALRWDLADDRIGADDAFFVACAIEPETGPYRYAIDLRDRAGSADAFPLIVERAVNVEHEGADARLYAKLYAAAARVAADAQMNELAIDAAVAAVRADPSRGDAVAIIEHTATGEQGLSALNLVYDTLADAALGRYGFRAAHYRAARVLEKMRAYDDALRHAIQAFEAVPNVGASFRMLLRLAERTGNEEAALNTLVAVAASFPSDRQLAWLVRAAELADDSRAGRELRFELLHKALVLRPIGDIVELLSEAASARLQEADETTRDLLHDRLERAARTTLERLKSAKSASAAVALAKMALELLGQPRLALEALSKGLDLNAQALDVSSVLESAEVLARETDLARGLLERVNELRGDPSRPLDTSVKDLMSKLYLELNFTPPPPTPVPEGGATSQSFEGFGDLDDEPAPDSGELVTQRPPPDFEEHPGLGAGPAKSPPLAAATDSDDRLLAAQLDSIVEADEGADARLFEAHFDALESGDAEPYDSRNVVHIVGELKAEEDIPTRRPPPDLGPPSPEEWAQPKTTAAEADDEPPPSEVMDLDDDDYVAITEPPPGDVEQLDEAVEALDEAAEAAAAAVSDPGVSEPGVPPELAPVEASEAVDFSPESEAIARERGDHRAIADMLAARIAATDNNEQRRLIRLRRAAVLEQRLNRIEDACTELEAILDESGDDPTALRYLADLRDRQGRHARAAKLWLRASQCALHLEEKIRDVARCCESLVKAGRPETAKKLIDAARGLPQSPRLLKLRVTVARRLDDPRELAAAEAELSALGASRRDPVSTPPPAEPLRALDGSPATGTRPATIPPKRPSEPPDALPGGAREAERDVFRVKNAPTPESGDEQRSASATLEACRRNFLQQPPENARQAKRLIRRLRAISNDIDDADRDLHSYLMVMCFDAADGAGAATHALQQHWERDGGTPLVTAAVADRLVQRGEIRPALLLYQRVIGRNLRGLRNEADVAMEAAELAHGVADHERAGFFLAHAIDADNTRERAETAIRAWYPDGLPQFESELDLTMPVPEVEALSSADDEPGVPSLTKTNAPPPNTQEDDEVVAISTPPVPRIADTSAARAQPYDAEAVTLERISLNDDGTAVTLDSSPPSVLAPTGPPSLRHANDEEKTLFEALGQGDYAAGEQLAALYQEQGDRRLLDLVTVRRLQATCRRGDRDALARLHDAAMAANADAYALAVKHVMYAFDADHAPPEPPPLNQLAAQPEATTKLLFHQLDGTINEALAIVCESGMMRRELSDYDFTGTDRVPPVATTPVGRCYATLSRLLDLGSTRLFHRSRSRGRLEGKVALLSPLAAVLSGNADRETATLRYVLGSVLAAAAPPLALVEGLDEDQARNLIQALYAGFGPVDDTSIQQTSQEQMRIAEDLWHMVGSAADHRLRELCESRTELSFEVARKQARRTRRRAGLFSCGDLVTAIMQVVHELDIPMPRPIRGSAALANLCQHPEVSDLYDLALLPEYADARWQLA